MNLLIAPRRLAWCCVTVASVTLIATNPRIGQAVGEPPEPAVERSHDGKPVEFVSPEVARLDMFIGAWNVTETHFNPQGDKVASVKGTEEMVWILDHRVIRRTYITSTETSVFRATGTLTWNAVEKVYHGVWFDNVSTSGPMVAKGTWDEDTRTMLFTLESSGPGGATVRHKVVEQLVDSDNRVATTYLLQGSALVKRLEVQYKRAIPCPATNSLRIIGQ